MWAGMRRREGEKGEKGRQALEEWVLYLGNGIGKGNGLWKEKRKEVRGIQEQCCKILSYSLFYQPFKKFFSMGIAVVVRRRGSRLSDWAHWTATLGQAAILQQEHLTLGLGQMVFVKGIAGFLRLSSQDRIYRILILVLGVAFVA